MIFFRHRGRWVVSGTPQDKKVKTLPASAGKVSRGVYHNTDYFIKVTSPRIISPSAMLSRRM